MDPSTLALRAARAVPHTPLGDAAAAAGVSGAAAAAGLVNMRWRGPCDSLLAAGYATMSDTQFAAAVTDRRCPPPLVRLAIHWSRPGIRLAGLGTTAWSRRQAHSVAAPRSALANTLEQHFSDANPNIVRSQCPPVMLERLADHQRRAVRYAAARNPSCSAVTLARLAEDPHTRVRTAAADHPACGAATLARLAEDPEKDVRRTAAAHPSCAPLVLKRLAADSDWWVRQTAAANKACWPSVLAEMSEDGTYEVRRVVAESAAVWPATLGRLAGDSVCMWCVKPQPRTLSAPPGR